MCRRYDWLHFNCQATMYSTGTILVTALAASASLVGALPSPQVQQIPFTSPNAVRPSSGSLVRIQQDQEDYTVFSHEHFPNHKVRAIQPKGLCDSKVEQWSGYLDTPNNRHFYFW